MSGPAGISIFFRPLQQFELHTTCLTRLGNIKCQVRFQSFHFCPTTQCTKTKSSVKLSQTNYLDNFLLLNMFSKFSLQIQPNEIALDVH